MDTIRPLLQPITHNLPAPIRDLGLALLGDACYKTLILDIDPTSTECLKLAVSKALGVGIIATSSIVKVPQILKLVSSKSPAGISFLSYLLETTSYLISLAYNFRSGFPFSTYGETALILVQNVVISVLVLQYSGKLGAAGLFVGGLAVGGAVLFAPEGVLGMRELGYLQAAAGVLSVGSKVPQILTVASEGSTGQLSAFAVFNYLAGSASRIFTTLQEVNDKQILYGFIAGFVLNAVLALQMVYYWNAPSKKAKGKRRETPINMSSSSATAGSTTGAASSPSGKSKGPTTRRRG